MVGFWVLSLLFFLFPGPSVIGLIILLLLACFILISSIVYNFFAGWY